MGLLGPKRAPQSVAIPLEHKELKSSKPDSAKSVPSQKKSVAQAQKQWDEMTTTPGSTDRTDNEQRRRVSFADGVESSRSDAPAVQKCGAEPSPPLSVPASPAAKTAPAATPAVTPAPVPAPAPAPAKSRSRQAPTPTVPPIMTTSTGAEMDLNVRTAKNRGPVSSFVQQLAGPFSALKRKLRKLTQHRDRGKETTDEDAEDVRQHL